MAEKGRGRARGKGMSGRTPRPPDPDTITQLLQDHAQSQPQLVADHFVDAEATDISLTASSAENTTKTTIGEGKTPPVVKDLKDALKQGANVGTTSTLNPQSPEFAPPSTFLSYKDPTISLSNGPSGEFELAPHTTNETPCVPMITKQAPTSTGSSAFPKLTQPSTKLNISAPVFVPRDTGPLQNGVDPEFAGLSVKGEEEVSSFGSVDIIHGFTPVVPLEDLERVPIMKTASEVLVKGGVYVGSFDRLKAKLQTTLSSFPPSEDALTNLAEMLVYWGVSEPYYRFTACKMCEVLCEEAESFRKILVRRLMDWYKRESSTKMELSEERCNFINFSLFFSELFTRVKLGGQPIEIFSDSIFQIVDTLLTLKSDETVIGACNILKLTGALLEQCGKTGSNAKMNEVIELLKKLCLDESLSRSCTDVLVRVIQQSAQKWGETVGVSSETPPSLRPPPAQEEKGKLNIDAIPFIPSGDFLVQQPVSNVEEWGEFETDYGVPIDDGGVVYDYPDGAFDEDGLDPDIELEMEAFIDEIEEHLLMQDFDPEQFSHD